VVSAYRTPLLGITNVCIESTSDPLDIVVGDVNVSGAVLPRLALRRGWLRDLEKGKVW
jgi:hypothetical protein